MDTPLLDDTQYPQRWRDYIGQQHAKDSLQVAAKSARIRKQPLGHVLIANPKAGIGKTALAVLTAREMKANVHVTSGAMDGDTARFQFAEMLDGDVLVYEEFHRLFDGKRWGWLLNYMQDGVIEGPLGMEEQPQVTIIATTTEPDIIPTPVAQRFRYKPMLVSLTEEEAAKVASQMSHSILGDLPPLRKKDALALARGACCNPRQIRQLLMILLDLTVTGTLPHPAGGYDIPGLLRWEGITEDGLDQIAQRYLVVLATELGGRAGERAMADRLQWAGGLAEIERQLMDRGLLGKTPTGRALTQAGIVRTKALLAEGAA